MLDPVFVAIVETWDDEAHAVGAIWLRDDRLLYEPSAGGRYSFRFDPVGRTYAPQARIDRVIVPHVPPEV